MPLMNHSNRCLFPNTHFLHCSDAHHKTSAPAALPICNLLPPITSTKLQHETLSSRKNKRHEFSQSIEFNIDKLSYYSFLLQSCIDSGSFDAGKSIHAQMAAEGVVPDPFLQTKLLMLYARAGEEPDMLAAHKMFGEMTERNSTSWNTMILAYARAGDYLEVLQLFTGMHKDGVGLDRFTFPSVLKACVAVEDEGSIPQLHNLIIKHGLSQNVVIGSALVDGYVAIGSLHCAETAFDEIDGVNIITLNAIISGYVRSLRWEDVWTSFHSMQGTGLTPNHSTFSMAAQASGSLRSLTRGKQVHAKVIVSGYGTDVFVGNSLINMYAQCGDLEGCELLFHLMKESSHVSWNSTISSYVHLGYYEEALHMLHTLQQSGFQYDRFNLGSGLMACAALADAETGRTIHGYLMKRLLDSDVVLGTALIDMYGKGGCMREARQVFNRLEERNVVSWNSLISGFVLEEEAESVIELYHQMKLANIKPDQFTLSSLLGLSANQANADLGKEIHGHILRKIRRPDLVLETELVHMYARCGRLKDAQNVFSRMRAKNGYSWNSFIKGCLKNSQVIEALRLFHEMQLNGQGPDCFSICSALSAISVLPSLDEGKQIHCFIIKNMLVDHNVVRCMLVDMYAKCECIDYAYRVYDCATDKDLILNNAMISAFISHQKFNDARGIFEEMEERDMISWNSMLIGLAKGDFEIETYQLFQNLIRERGDFDCSTLVPVFNVCAGLAAADLGKQLHVCAMKKGLTNSSVVLDSAIVDMYAKCGMIEEARQVFNRMKERNVSTWNTMISGHSKHGQSREVFSLYEEMKREAICPNDITFLSILSACSHAGLLELGFHTFATMLEEHGVEPRVEHYNCMVDLLGRAGLLNDAKEMIMRMPMEPDISTWAALLGASRVHSNISIGRFVAKKLFQLDPSNSGHYRLMANIYAAAGKWKEVNKMWKLMKEIGASEPGVSWIEVGNEIQVFRAGDWRHPKSEETYATLKSLSSYYNLIPDVEPSRLFYLKKDKLGSLDGLMPELDPSPDLIVEYLS